LSGGTDCEPFKKNPPFTFGLLQARNMLMNIGPSVAAAFWPFFPAVSEAELAAPTTTAGLRAYYNVGSGAPAIFRMYRPEGGKTAYKALVQALDVWKARVGWRGHFNLLNYEPGGVTCSVVSSAAELTDFEARKAAAFVPLGLPPTGAAWKMMNSLHIRVLFTNNYGRHSLRTAARPTAFLWDWVGMAAPIAGVGCIQINGQFMAWTRWTRAGLDAAEDILAPVLGARIGELQQMAPV
jgi:hypothetical protein